MNQSTPAKLFKLSIMADKAYNRNSTQSKGQKIVERVHKTLKNQNQKIKKIGNSFN